MTRAATAVALALLTAACGPKLMKLPSGAGLPASDGSEALAQATRACRDVHTITAEIAVSGALGGQRVRARLIAGFAAPASARIEAAAPFGPPIFIFVASHGDGQVLLPRDDRFVPHAAPEELLEAVAGVRFTPANLMEIVDGCAAPPLSIVSARSIGERWRVIATAGERAFYVERSDPKSPWRLSAMVIDGADPLRVEYRAFESGFPREIHLLARENGQKPRYDLTLTLSQVDFNTTLGADVFRVQIPSSAVPMTVDELKRAGILPRTQTTAR